MKKSKFTESKILFALVQAQTGTPTAKVCRKMGVSEATIHNWKHKYSVWATPSCGACASSRWRTCA